MRRDRRPEGARLTLAQGEVKALPSRLAFRTRTRPEHERKRQAEGGAQDGAQPGRQGIG